jgi:hypothetical protein
MINECGAADGMRIGRGKRKPTTVPLCPIQITHDMTSDGTGATEM